MPLHTHRSRRRPAVRLALAVAGLTALSACGETVKRHSLSSPGLSAPVDRVVVKGAAGFRQTVTPISTACGAMKYEVDFTNFAQDEIANLVHRKLVATPGYSAYPVPVTVERSQMLVNCGMTGTWSGACTAETRVTLTAEPPGRPAVKAVSDTLERDEKGDCQTAGSILERTTRKAVTEAAGSLADKLTGAP
ncbi:MAG TPA: hypothetical protein VED40_15330 [Azospirillaceae bacterium]|nr:hypothetical protein [Azospirillaceae bacterium]